MIGENHRLVGGEQRIEGFVIQAMRMFGRRLKRHQVHHVHHPHLQVGHDACASSDVAARVSSVGTSPAQAITTSGSPPQSLLAHSQIPMPAVQCLQPNPCPAIAAQAACLQL